MKSQSSNTPNIEGIQSSLRYLSNEAKDAGLSEIATMIEQAAFKCKSGMNESTLIEGASDSEEIVKAINFLYHFYKASETSQGLFLQYIEDISKQLASGSPENQIKAVPETSPSKRRKWNA